jgi:hypothetical protein
MIQLNSVFDYVAIPSGSLLLCLFFGHLSFWLSIFFALGFCEGFSGDQEILRGGSSPWIKNGICCRICHLFLFFVQSLFAEGSFFEIWFWGLSSFFFFSSSELN